MHGNRGYSWMANFSSAIPLKPNLKHTASVEGSMNWPQVPTLWPLLLSFKSEPLYLSLWSKMKWWVSGKHSSKLLAAEPRKVIPHFKERAWNIFIVSCRVDRNEHCSILTGFLVLLAILLGTFFLSTWSFIFRNRYLKDMQMLLSLSYSFVSAWPLRQAVSCTMSFTPSWKEYQHGCQCKERPAGLQSVDTLQCSTNSLVYNSCSLKAGCCILVTNSGKSTNRFLKEHQDGTTQEGELILSGVV